MLKNINPTQTNAWKALTAHFESAQDMDLKSLFAQDAQRFDKFSTRFGSGILVDYSKNLINEETLQHLQALANETELKSAIDAMLQGCAIITSSVYCTLVCWAVLISLMDIYVYVYIQSYFLLLL